MQGGGAADAGRLRQTCRGKAQAQAQAASHGLSIPTPQRAAKPMEAAPAAEAPAGLTIGDLPPPLLGRIMSLAGSADEIG